MTNLNWVSGALVILMFAINGTEQAFSAEPPLILDLNFESGTLDGWGQIRKNLPTVIQAPEPVREGQYAISPFLDGTGWGTHGGERCEVVARGSNSSSLPFGEYWYGFSVFLPDSWVPDTIWEMIAQFHTDDLDYPANPVLAFEIRRPSDGSSPKRTNWSVASRWDPTPNATNRDTVTQTYYDLGEYETGKWTDFVINVRWAWDHGQGGFLKLWKDGQLVIDAVHPSSYNTSSKIPYFKMGIYKGWDTSPPTPEVQTRTAFFDSFRMAGADGSYDMVSPAGGVAPPKTVERPVVD